MIFLPCNRTHWFLSVAPVTRIFTFTVDARRVSGRRPGAADMAVFKKFGVPAGAMELPPPPDPDKRPPLEEVLKLVEEGGIEFPFIRDAGWQRAYGATQAKYGPKS